MNNEFYNRVFLSNKLLNTATVQPVIRPAKVEENEQIINENLVDVKNKPVVSYHTIEKKINGLEENINELQEKNKNLEDKVNKLLLSLKSLEKHTHPKNIIEFELNEFDKMIVKDEPNIKEES